MNLFKGARYVAMAAALAAPVVVVACGKVDTGGPSDAGPGGPTPQHPTPGYEGGRGPLPELEAGPFDGAMPDGGPGPVVPCGDASADGSTACTIPPSDCLDDHTMRYYTAATCNEDAGLCEYRISTMPCPRAPMPPDCYQGGCRIVGVR
jgi:hypothetical protein